MHVALCVDRNFVLPLAACLASIDAKFDSASINIHVLHPGLSTVVRNKIESTLARVSIYWHEVDESHLRGAHFTKSLSIAALYRLLLHDLLPKEVEKFLYIDADTVVEDSLTGLLNTDLKGSIIGAVRDSGTPWAAGLNGASWEFLGLEPSWPYFNSGVLLIDRSEWESNAIGYGCLDLLRRENLRWGDQDALNAIVRDRWLQLPLRWNVQTPQYQGNSATWALWTDEVRRAVAMPGIVHFTMRPKPWIYGSTHPATERWFHWLDQTAWSGWRPSMPHRLPGVKPVRLMRQALAKWSARQSMPKT